jgi:uroporphyrinogen-III synthase
VKGWRLLLTRPAEESQTLAQVLADEGVFSASLPLLEIEPLPVCEANRSIIYNLATYCAVIVVSKPAARLGLEMVDEVWPQPPMQTWFTVGAATAQILDDYGLRVFFPEQGDDSEALLSLPQLEEAISGYDPKVLIMRGEGGASFWPNVCANGVLLSIICRCTVVTCRSTRLSPSRSVSRRNA